MEECWVSLTALVCECIVLLAKKLQNKSIITSYVFIHTFKLVINRSVKSSESFLIWLGGCFAKCMAYMMRF